MSSRGQRSPKSKCRPWYQKNQSGQASLMMGLMFLTFIMLFAMVVNLGMLVAAKISLQNAADAAAYAGAAVQARQLNQIGFLNFELKRQYKKFLFRYYVMGNLGYPDGPTKPGAGKWNFAPRERETPYNAPVTCIVFNADDNSCQNRTLAKIRIPKASPGDMLQSALIKNIEQMEALRQESCRYVGETNRQVLGYWLWNTDPEFDDLAAGSGLTERQKAHLSILRSLAYGLGLVPRQILTQRRIDTLKFYVNYPAQEGVTLSRANQLKNDGDVARKERTIQAFMSAYLALGNHMFNDTESITLDEISPQGAENQNFLQLENVGASFDTFYADVRRQFDTPEDANNSASRIVSADCKSVAMPMSVRSDIPVAVYKKPETLTYYAVRLKARAKVLFNPFGSDIELTAYSAAQPFGSRIGPQVSPEEFVTKVAGDSVSPEACLSGINTCVGQVPNLRMTEKFDWWNREVLHSMYQQFFKSNAVEGAGTPNQRINLEAMLRAYHSAMAPTQLDKGKYTIPEDLVTDPFQTYFTNPTTLKTSFWAPIQSSDDPASSDPQELLKSMLEMLNVKKAADLIPNRATQAADSEYGANFSEAFLSSMKTYLSRLREGAGEEGEGFNVAVITDPFHERPSSNGGAPKLLSFTLPELFLSEPAEVRSSWSDLQDGAHAALGRTGYSVKFVSFKTLMNSNQTADGATPWRNPPRASSDGMSKDFTRIEH